MKLINKIKLLPDAFRGFLFCDPERNGEYRLLNKTIKDGMTIFDVGANIGEYAEYISALKNNLELHCFEPSKNTFIKLQKRISLDKGQNKFHLNNYGLSNIDEELELHIYNETGGSNSIYFNDQFSDNKDIVKKEKIRLRKLDDYIKENKIKKIDFLKIDVEGHESNVINGCVESLKSGIIKSIQFEYNNYWFKSDTKLLEMLKFLELYDYEFYRLTPWGKIKIRRFKPNLENYKHSNYYAVKND
jgi:FkbM family methyltransferase